MPPQVEQGQSIPRLDLTTLLGKLYAEHLRRESNYNRFVTRYATRLAEERKTEARFCRGDAKCQVNERVLSRLGAEKCSAVPLWDHVIEKLFAKCDLDLDDSGGLGPRFRELLERYCHAVMHDTLSWMEPPSFSAWIARLDKTNFAEDLLADLWKLYPRACKRLALPTPTVTGDDAVIGAPPGKRPAGKGMSWRKAKEAAERHVKRNNHVFPGVNVLARVIGCASSTVLKVIKKSTYLAARKAEHERDAKKPKEVALTRGVLAITSQQRETDPSDVELARLTKEQADERAREERQHTKRQHTPTPHK